jgi:hypothetical protein
MESPDKRRFCASPDRAELTHKPHRDQNRNIKRLPSNLGLIDARNEISLNIKLNSTGKQLRHTRNGQYPYKKRIP